MFFFNFLFWVSGLILIIVGAVVEKKYGSEFEFLDTKYSNAPILLIAVGVIVFIIGFLGCCGACKDNYCMVTTFAVLLGVIFILEIVAGAIGFAYKGKVKEVAEKALDKAKSKYEESSVNGATKFIDWTQENLECCGVTDYKTDWANKNGTCGNAAVNGFASCHKDKDCKKKLYTTGCVSVLMEFLKNNMVLVGGVAIGIGLIQLLGIVFACLLMKKIKEEYEVV